jgi:hypothetical protein
VPPVGRNDDIHSEAVADAWSDAARGCQRDEQHRERLQPNDQLVSGTRYLNRNAQLRGTPTLGGFGHCRISRPTHVLAPRG